MTISVLLVDDHELIRQGLRRAFERDQEFEVVGEAASIADAKRLIGLVNPDVTILDVQIGRASCRERV